VRFTVRGPVEISLRVSVRLVPIFAYLFLHKRTFGRATTT